MRNFPPTSLTFARCVLRGPPACVPGRDGCERSGWNGTSGRELGAEQALDVVVFWFDRRGRFTAGGGALRELGIDGSGVIGRAASELGWDELDAPGARSAGGAREVNETRVEFARDERNAYTAVVTAMRDNSGRIIGGTVSLRSLTEQRAAEERLAEAERHARTVIELSGDLHSRTDGEGRLLYVSPTAQQLLGYEPCELLGRNPSEFAHPDDRVCIDAAMRQLSCSGAAELEYRFKHRDGHFVWFHVLLRARRDQHGRIIETVRTARDISAQRAVEEKLAEAERQARAVIELSGDMHSRTDPQGRCLWVSPRSVGLIGYEPEELIGRLVADTAHPDDVEAIDASIRELSKRGSAEVEYRVRHKDGHYVWLHVLLRARFDEHGNVVEIVRAARDVSAQVIELSGDMHSRTDTEGRLLWTSPRSVALIGYEPEELIGKRLIEFAHPDDLQAFNAASAVASEHGAAELEYRVRHKHGHYVWLHVLLRARYDDHGRLVEIVGAARDVSAQRAAEEALAQAEREARTIIELSGDLHTRTDADGCLLYISPNSENVIGYTPEELRGHRPGDYAHPDDAARCEAVWREAREHGSAEIEYRVRRPDGRYVWIHALLRSRYDEHGNLVETVRAARNITEQKVQQAQLREATERFERAFHHAPIGMALVDLDGSCLKVNREMRRITGYSESELLRKSLHDLIHPDDVDESREWLAGLRDASKSEKRCIHADGHTIWVQLACSMIRDDRGQPQHLVAQIQDITEPHELQQRLSHLAEHDALTDLHNRRRFESELERQVSRSRRYDERAALIMIDLDHFKYFNDALGHGVGDQLIKHVGQLLRQRLRGSDILARLGGDEYAVLLPHVDAASACLVAAELIERIEQEPFIHGEQPYTLSASAGVLLLDSNSASAEDALVSADIALYDAKRQGRNRVAAFRPDTRHDVLAGLSWSQRLKDALAKDLFVLHAQPIVDLQSGQTQMHELLIRMTTEDGQLVQPGRFLPAAQRFGFMPAIDRWVIAQTAQLASALPGRTLAINLAANTLSEPGLVRYITDTLSAAGARYADIVFEVSESDVIANLDDASAVCAQLRALGSRIALDDFGSGFSGFSYLKALRVDLLKIDGQFVRELVSNDVDQLVVEAILHVAKGMQLPTVAEYVTNEAIAKQLRGMGATYGQGFHLGRPTPLEPAKPQAQRAA